MKKFLSIILSVFMIASILGTITLADSGSANVKFTVDKTNAVVGDEVTVTISNDEMTVSSFTCGIKFDKDKLECKAIEGASGKAIKVSYQGEEEQETQNLSKSTASEANGAGTVGMYFTGTEDVKYNAGVLSKITFTVKAAGDASITLYEDSDGTDGFRADTIESKTITIQSTPTHTHSWSTTWNSDATHHWHECTGAGTCENGNKKDNAEHTWTAATCTTAKTCSVCGYTTGNALGHDYTEKIEDDAHLKKAATKCTEYNEYWYDCSKCDANAKNDTAATDKYFKSTTAKGAHNFNRKVEGDTYYVAGTGADCQHAKEYYYACADCNAVGTVKWTSTQKGSHSFDTTAWGYKGSDGHAHKCTVSGCTEHGTVTTHTPGEAATETTPQTCTECGYVIAPATGHIRHTLTKHSATATCTEAGNIEYWTCSGCNKKFSDANGTTEITNVTTPATGHTASNEWSKDDQHHWHVCTVCQAELDKAPHSYAGDSNTCICGHQREVTPPTDTVKVTFDANGGKFSDGSTTKEITGETAVAIADCRENPTRENYRFDGWYASATGGTALEPNDNYHQDTTVYAHWTYIGGDGSITIITHPDNDTTGTKENPGTGAAPSGIGYVFVGLAAVGALCFGAKKLIKKEEE